MVQALQSRNFLVDQVQVYGMMQGGSQNAFLPAGTNDEIEIILAPTDERCWRKTKVSGFKMGL